MTTDLTGSGPADSPSDAGLTGHCPGVHQLTDAERTYPALADDGHQPLADLPAGMSWLGVSEDGRPLLVRSWVCDGEGPARVPHVWVIGRTGSGRSATVRALLGPDLAAGREVLLPLEGAGTMSPALAGFALTGAIARTAQEWLDALTLAYAVMRARLERLDTANAWRRPSPTDPIVTLLVDDCAQVSSVLPEAAAAMVCEIAGMGRDLGVRVVQIAPSPLTEHLIGGSEFGSQCRLVLGHAVTDPVHHHIPAQGAAADGVSLLGLPAGHVVAVVDGVAVRGQVAMVPEQTRQAGTDRAALDPGDLTDDVRHALAVCSDPWWGTHPDAVHAGQDEPRQGEVPVAACDNASVGVVIHDPGTDRWLLFERGRAPIGVAPVAGHVFDEHAAPSTDLDVAYEAAARAEVREELGLSVVDLVDPNVGGWRPNRCRRPAGPRGTGHEWRIYCATVTGELSPSPDEARRPQWLTRAELQQLADRTVAYAQGVLGENDWTGRPGIEPVWVDWLAQLGLVRVDLADLVLVEQLAAGVPVRRVVFGDELGEGTTVLEPCRNPRACRQHCPTWPPAQAFHRLTLQRLRRSHSGWITAVVTDQDGVEQPWQSGPNTPVHVVATTLPIPPAAAGPHAADVSTDAVAVPEPGPDWAGIPADPRWDPYRLRMAGPRWWRPWWTAHIDYLGAWATHGDQTIIRVRSWRRTRAIHEAADALVDHCRWLIEHPHPNDDVDLVPVVWLGAHLVPVAHLAGQDDAKAQEVDR